MKKKFLASLLLALVVATMSIGAIVNANNGFSNGTEDDSHLHYEYAQHVNEIVNSHEWYYMDETSCDSMYETITPFHILPATIICPICERTASRQHEGNTEWESNSHRYGLFFNCNYERRWRYYSYLCPGGHTVSARQVREERHHSSTPRDPGCGRLNGSFLQGRGISAYDTCCTFEHSLFEVECVDEVLLPYGVELPEYVYVYSDLVRIRVYCDRLIEIVALSADRCRIASCSGTISTYHTSNTSWSDDNHRYGFLSIWNRCDFEYRRRHYARRCNGTTVHTTDTFSVREERGHSTCGRANGTVDSRMLDLENYYIEYDGVEITF